MGQKESIPRDKRSDRNLGPSLLLASRNVHNAKCTRIGINIFREQCEQISAIRLVQFLVETIRLGRRTELWSCVLRLLQPRPQVLLVFQYGGGRREPVFFLYFQILHETHQNTGIAARANALKCLILIIVNAFFSFWSLDRLRKYETGTPEKPSSFIECIVFWPPFPFLFLDRPDCNQKVQSSRPKPEKVYHRCIT